MKLPLALVLLALRPEGAQFRVNSATTAQYLPQVAAAPFGSFVVAWEAKQAGVDGRGIFLQRFNVIGSPIGATFRVNTYTTGGQLNAAVAVDHIGNFVVAWTSVAGEDGDQHGVFGRVFDRVGLPIGGPFRVNSTTAGIQEKPSIAIDPSGPFVIAFEGEDGDGNGVFARRFLANGVARGQEFLVSAATTSSQARPSAAADGSGAFVVAWTADQGGGNYDVFARRFAANGTPRTSEFRVNVATPASQIFVQVAAAPSGRFIVAWNEDLGFPEANVFARGFSGNGAPATPDVKASALTTGFERSSVAVLPDGEFIVGWAAYPGPGPEIAVFVSRFSPSGAPLGSAFRVNTTTTGKHRFPRIATHGRGFVVVWEAQGVGVFAQRFSTVPLAGDADGSGAVNVNDVLYLINFLFAGGPAPVG